jgi:cell division protein FtsL
VSAGAAARTVADPLPGRRRSSPHTDPARTKRAPAARPRISIPSHPRRRARRGFHPAFWILTAAVVTTMVVALASVSALVVQTSFGIDSLEARIAELGDRQQYLTREAASLSSPSRVAAWARRRGMVMPEDVVVVQVPGAAAGAGAAG